MRGIDTWSSGNFFFIKNLTVGAAIMLLSVQLYKILNSDLPYERVSPWQGEQPTSIANLHCQLASCHCP
jgi:hypothetical protein